ncbi:MAG TPA: hypothetical protein VFV07_08025, partial [Rhizomicrobium sp.]|nr:hypothetical protein [Rhizomicrobium sp.]
MDAAAQLALMAKAKLVFETPGTFLSFPFLSPLAFHPSQLDFTQAATDTSVAAALRDFSLAVNSCPASSIFAPVGDDYLWDRYDTWLNAMTLAGNQLSPADQAAYTAARTLLVVTDSNGYDADSPKVVAYKRCRDALFAAQQAYNAAKLTASSGDANAQATWQSTDEPRLKSAIDAASSDWNTTGYKADVEAAQGTVARCEAHMPEAIWAQWRHLYNPDLDRVTDPASNSSYALSGFTPGDLATQSWTPLHLSGLEIAVLKATAPLELQAIFGAVGQSDIATISFEFRSCAVVRPWFTNAVSQSRFWKFADGSVLSDGASPANGAWPAYVSAVVFVRNVQVTYASAPAAPPQAKSAIDLLRISNVQTMPHVLFNQSQPRPMPHVNFQRAAAFA